MLHTGKKRILLENVKRKHEKLIVVNTNKQANQSQQMNASFSFSF